MTDQFERENLEVEIIEAVDAKSFNFDIESIRPGEFANIASHRKIWLDMIEKGHTKAITLNAVCSNGL